MDLEEALNQLKDLIKPIQGTEQVKLDQAGLRVLATDVMAPLNLPPFAASAMDGYAVRKQDWLANPTQTFEIVGQSLAGHPCPIHLGTNQAMRIFTGAAVPAGADQVFLQEDAHIDKKQPNLVSFAIDRIAEDYIRPIGHDLRQGQLLAPQGTTLSALVRGMLTAAGLASVTVVRKPRVGVFSTGDELVDAGTPHNELKAGQIYDSNRFTVLGLLNSQAFELVDLGRLADDPGAVEEALRAASKACDAIITSGGVSVGDADFITTTIRQLGQLDFWKLNLKPGKPLAVGSIDKCWIFGLPGNPVSTIVTLLLIAKPALEMLAGNTYQRPARIPAILQQELKHTPGRAEYQRGIFAKESNSEELTVRHTGDQSSNRMTTFADANCLIEIPSDSENIAANSNVYIIPFTGLLS